MNIINIIKLKSLRIWIMNHICVWSLSQVASRHMFSINKWIRKRIHCHLFLGHGMNAEVISSFFFFLLRFYVKFYKQLSDGICYIFLHSLPASFFWFSAGAKNIWIKMRKNTFCTGCNHIPNKINFCNAIFEQNNQNRCQRKHRCR